MGAIADIWKSERGFLLVIFAVGATVLTALGQLTSEQWMDYTKFMFAAYVVGKTVTGGIDSVMSPKNPPPVPPNTPDAGASTTVAVAVTTEPSK